MTVKFLVVRNADNQKEEMYNIAHIISLKPTEIVQAGAVLNIVSEGLIYTKESYGQLHEWINAANTWTGQGIGL